ncbi:MAG: hypothetical protein M3Q14_00890 [bacterium]|nr:hypothetical protein [bacterium]
MEGLLLPGPNPAESDKAEPLAQTNPGSPNSKLQHDARGLSFADFHRLHGGNWGRNKRNHDRNQKEYAKKGMYTSAHRVVARYAMIYGGLVYNENEIPLIPRDTIEEVANLLEVGQKLPVFYAGPYIKDVLYEILDLTEPASQDINPLREI